MCVELIETTSSVINLMKSGTLTALSLSTIVQTDVSASILPRLAGQREKRKNNRNPDIKVSEEPAPLNQEPYGRGALQASAMEIGNQHEQNPSACYPSLSIDLQLWESSNLYNQNTDRHFSF